VKIAVKAGKAQGAKIVSRIVDVSDADAWAKKIDALNNSIDQILTDEKEEKSLSSATMQLRKGENIIEHEAEILARPKRTWFESEKEKRNAKNAGRTELNGLDAGNKKGKAGKLSGKERKRLDDGRERGEGRVWKKGAGERGTNGSGKKDKGAKPAKGGRGGAGRGGDRGAGRGVSRGGARGGSNGSRGRGRGGRGKR